MAFVIPVVLDPATRQNLESIQSLLMLLLNATQKGVSTLSQLSDQLTAVQGDLTAMKTDVATIAAGVKALDDLITSFQNSPGTLSPQDQAALDAIQAASTDLRKDV